MRYFTFIVIFCISVSCQRKDNDQSSHDLSYSVDTVIIDSKGRFLDLDGYILNSDLDDEERSIFLYNSFDHSIDEVNLDNLSIINNYLLEVEGPDGTGAHVDRFNVLKNGLFFIKSFNRSAVFDKNGRIIKRIDWVNSIDSNSLKYDKIPQNEMLININAPKVFGLSYNNKNREVFLDVFSVQDDSIKRFDIDPENSYHNFVLEIEDPQYRTFMDPLVYMGYENNIIFSHQYSSEMIIFNTEGEFVKTVYYEPTMTPKRVNDLSGSITSNEQIQKEYQHFLEQVRFGPPVWDRVKQRYLRLSAKRVFSDITEERSFLPETNEINVYLTVFDAEFNLISELAIPELSSEFVKYFAKDGKFWVYENFSDELGFIILDI
jgi:hypothetical protein